MACKSNVKIEIVELILISLNKQLSIEELKEFTHLQNDSNLLARDYIKAKRRSDLGVVLEEFIDEKKTIINIDFAYQEDFKLSLNQQIELA